jgi:serine/threonine protein kinase
MSTVAPAVVIPRVGGFQIIQELGHGGMGNVYLARQASSGRWAALKVIAAPADRDPKARARFAREIAAVSRVRHPNVVRLLGHGIEDGSPYALFEHVAGCDLGCIGGPLPWPVVVHLARQLARAIAAVHDAGLVHRDIKPANVMVSRRCRLTLIDFGLAKLTAGDDWTDEDALPVGTFDDRDDGLTEPGSVAGTPRYLAPEVRLGEPASIASDLYSFGLVVHQMLTGRSPSTETTASELDRLDVPRLLRGLVARCLDPDPAERPQRASTAIAILDLLDAQPAVIVRVCRVGTVVRGGIANAPTRCMAIQPAEATMPTEIAAPLIARVRPLPDGRIRASGLRDRDLPHLPTLAYPRRARLSRGRHTRAPELPASALVLAARG